MTTLVPHKNVGGTLRLCIGWGLQRGSYTHEYDELTKVSRGSKPKWMRGV
uniref:Uncharacterized protein n=1 Tax=Rhodococcus hoagii TaxID=43767 RepID=A0A0F7IBH7_RHOHA|nr:hypothetical protein pVAPN2012_0790 [Prescottella equi]AKG90533.1 hypothetical protein pVAPN_0790 [Prescottella equi]ARX59685.1 hypothetical protein pVAPN1204_0790 [Prescottella equi]ARX59829.1 hypothetical protein pVAPN1354_0790 [Prescottella equi]ARX59977.1 hypothetical protein pVAPN1557_0790 [Prescottella equi]